MMRNRLTGLCLALALGLSPAAGHAASYFDKARTALAKGQLRTAEIELRNAVRSDPQNAAARYWLGRVELQLGNPVAAEQQAKEAQARGFDPQQSVALLGQALLAQNRPDDVLKQLRPTGKNNKVDSEIEVVRGAAHLALDDPDKAAASFAQAEKLNPANVAAWVADARLALARHDTKAAGEKLDRALAADAKSVQARTLKAQLMAMNHDAAGALKLLDATIADSPPAIPARLLRANMLIAEGKDAAAKQDDDAVLKLVPANVEGLFIKAVLLHRAKHDHQAELVLEHLAPVFPQMPRGYFMTALVKLSLGDLQQAEQAARQYVSHAPGDLVGDKLLAEIEFKLKRPDRAIAPLAKAVADGRADAQTYDMLARAYAATGQVDEAAKDFAKAASLAPRDAGVQTQLASTMLQLGRPNEAVSDLERALTLAPKQPKIAEALFLAAVKTGDLDKAAAVLAKIKAAQGDTMVVQNLTGLLQLARLDLSDAKATFQAIAAKQPDFLPAQVNLARTLAMQGDMAGFEQTLSAILKKSPTAEPPLTLLTDRFLATGRKADAIDLMEKAHAAAPKNLALTLRLGDFYIRSGEPKKALGLLQAGSSGGTSGTALLGLQAAAQLALKQDDQARETLTKLLAAEPRALAARRQLAALMIKSGDYQSARNLIKTGISLAPNDYQLYLDYALVDLKDKGIAAALSTARALQTEDAAFAPLTALPGDLYLADKKPAEALKAYQKASAEHPSLLLTGRMATALAREGKQDQAEALLKDWLAKNPQDIGVANALSGIAITQHHYAEAKTYLQMVLTKAPHNAGVLNNLAWVDQQLGDKDAAELARKAYLLAPSAQTADTFGWILTSTGDNAKGLVLLRQAASGSKDPRIAYHYAVALNDAGQRDAAIKLLKDVVAAKGSFTEKTEAQTLLTKLTKGT